RIRTDGCFVKPPDRPPETRLSPSRCPVPAPAPVPLRDWNRDCFTCRTGGLIGWPALTGPGGEGRAPSLKTRAKDPATAPAYRDPVRGAIPAARPRPHGRLGAVPARPAVVSGRRWKPCANGAGRNRPNDLTGLSPVVGPTVPEREPRRGSRVKLVKLANLFKTGSLAQGVRRGCAHRPYPNRVGGATPGGRRRPRRRLFFSGSVPSMDFDS